MATKSQKTQPGIKGWWHRHKGAVIGGVAGAVVAGPVGLVVGAGGGYFVQDAPTTVEPASGYEQPYEEHMKKNEEKDDDQKE